MTNQAIGSKGSHLFLKEPAGWFAAGASFRQALPMLSDGAFKLFVYFCLEANRRTGRFVAVQAELAKAIGKSRRVVGKYIEELEQKGICTVRLGRNQYTRTCFEIRDEYWPYHRTLDVSPVGGQQRNDYLNTIKSCFVTLGCTSGKFTVRDEQLARELERQGVSLETLQDALFMGAARKYISWLNGGSPEPIGSLAYFTALVAEIQERPLPSDYRDYLRTKVIQLDETWMKESKKLPGNGRCLHRPGPEIVQ
jgi:hypothetical protein